MTERDFLIGIAVVAFALGTLALWLAVRSVLRRRRARQRQARVGLIFRGILITLLFALGVASLRGAPPPDLVNRPAPSDVGAVVAFVQNTREGESRTIQAVSARDGVTRWTHRLNGAVKSLLSPTAGIILAQMYDNGFYALRTSDGSVIWSYGAGLVWTTGPAATDGTNVYTVAPAASDGAVGAIDIVALNVLTGLIVWRTPLPVVIQQARSVAVADGDVFVAGDATDTGLEHDQWEVMSLGAADGAQRWLEASDTITGANMEVQALIVVGGNVIVAPMTGPLTAMRASSGATVWSGPELPAGANITTMLNYATSDGTRLYVMSHAFANSNGTITNFPVRLMAIEPSDGSVLWSRALDPYLSPETLTMSDGVLLSGKNVTATTGYDGFNENGSLLWAYDTTSETELWRDNSPPTGISWDLSPQMTPLGETAWSIWKASNLTSPYIRLLAWFFALASHGSMPSMSAPANRGGASPPAMSRWCILCSRISLWSTSGS